MSASVGLLGEGIECNCAENEFAAVECMMLPLYSTRKIKEKQWKGRIVTAFLYSEKIYLSDLYSKKMFE
jgi:hypothetical protein